MKYLSILLLCFGFIQGCSSDYAGNNRDGFQDGISPRTEFGSRCVVYWDSSDDNSTSSRDCTAQKDLVGAHCVCNTTGGIKNGSVR